MDIYLITTLSTRIRFISIPYIILALLFEYVIFSRAVQYLVYSQRSPNERIKAFRIRFIVDVPNMPILILSLHKCNTKFRSLK